METGEILSQQPANENEQQTLQEVTGGEKNHVEGK